MWILPTTLTEVSGETDIDPSICGVCEYYTQHYIKIYLLSQSTG